MADHYRSSPCFGPTAFRPEARQFSPQLRRSLGRDYFRRGGLPPPFQAGGSPRASMYADPRRALVVVDATTPDAAGRLSSARSMLLIAVAAQKPPRCLAAATRQLATHHMIIELRAPRQDAAAIDGHFQAPSRRRRAASKDAFSRAAYLTPALVSFPSPKRRTRAYFRRFTIASMLRSGRRSADYQ